MLRPIGYFFCVLLVVGAGTSIAARPDCSRARSNIERLMCSSDEIAMLDDRVALAFREAAYRATDRRELLEQQHLWQVEVRDVCNDLPCLREAYRKRIEEIEGR